MERYYPIFEGVLTIDLSNTTVKAILDKHIDKINNSSVNTIALALDEYNNYLKELILTEYDAKRTLKNHIHFTAPTFSPDKTEYKINFLLFDMPQKSNVDIKLQYDMTKNSYYIEDRNKPHKEL